MKGAFAKVSLKDRSYQIKIGAGSIGQLAKDLNKTESKKGFLISDESLIEHRQKVMSLLQNAGWQVTEMPVSAGESLKNLESLYPIYGNMLKAKIDRKSTLFALGGGSVGDAAGFVASTYMRGISWVGLPTTLLAQVDSSIGGKTAVNHPAGKNLIGTFHQPSLVICETSFLKTLSPRELISGLGEVIKYGLVFDPLFFNFVQKNCAKALAFDEKVLTQLIRRSVEFKARVVSQDEFDRTGKREVLNFGHTFGHSLESITDYQTFQHGEAIIWGMRFAAALSCIRGKLKETAWKKADEFLSSISVPPLPSDFSFEAYLQPIKHDKKTVDGKTRFVLLSAIGKSVLDKQVTEIDLHKAFTMIGGSGGR